MNVNCPNGFDAVAALDSYSHKSRVQLTDDQHLLDIASKQRTSVMPWRGQFSPQLIEHLLRKHSRAGDTILDPFCGSGTVLYEAAAQKMSAVGYDVNPAAVMLADFSMVCRTSTEQRVALIERISTFANDLRDNAETHGGELAIDNLQKTFGKIEFEGENAWLLKAFLLQVFGNSAQVKQRNILKAEKNVREALIGAPYYSGTLTAAAQDARMMPLDDESCSYVVTSPPYINVFNYHQNYRSITEALGCYPLVAARSEMGANRKFRQNRFITVTQYCMDIAETIVEMNRVLRERGKVTIVLGRTSNVRSVAFKNGELIAAIACDGLGANLVDWHERKFTNRFGETIFEDVLTLIPTAFDRDEAIEIGRQVGAQALTRALDGCREERREEIEQAIEASAKIEKSVYFAGCS